MAEVTMPRLSDTMEEGTIAAWLKKPGDSVNKGDVIAQVETDKATMDLTAFESGTLQEILEPEGSTVAIGKPVARIGAGGEKAAPAPDKAPAPEKEPSASRRAAAAAEKEAAAPEKEPSASRRAAAAAEKEAAAPEKEPSASRKEAAAAEKEAAASEKEPSASRKEAAAAEKEAAAPEKEAPAAEKSEAAPEKAPAPEEPSAEERNGKVRASPMARHIAAEHGIDLSSVSGSGPQGRVIRADVEAALSGKPIPSEKPTGPQPSAPTDGEERVQLSQMRRTIARRMAESTRTIPHFFLTTVIDATELSRLRKQVNEQTAEAGIKISFNDMIVKGAALAIRKVPEVNVSFAEDSLIRHSHVHVGIAVATDRGLIVPVIRDVDQKALGTVAKEARELAEKANAGKLQPPDYTGGTFTVSNLGMFGVEQFNAVINPPESAILAVGAIVKEPAEHNGQIELRERLRLTLSVDHRALDGAIGARYLQALKALLEKPMLLLV